jgi:uncharacterized membrane-anchored protein
MYHATTFETVAKSGTARAEESSEERREGTMPTNKVRSKMGIEEIEIAMGR